MQLHCVAPTTVQWLNWSVRGNVYGGSLSQRDGSQRHLLLMALRQDGEEYNPRLMILIEHVVSGDVVGCAAAGIVA